MTYELIDPTTLNTVASFDDLDDALMSWLDCGADAVLAVFDAEGICQGARVVGKENRG